MNSSRAAAIIQQTRERARAEYEAKTKGRIFTKDFQTRQDALMHDPLATVGERVMAWILRRSWGEMVLYAMKEDGEPAYQRDCAKELGIDKKQVSNAVAYYQKRGYLEDRPKLLYPVISPVLGGPNPKAKKSQEFVTFFEEWKVTHSPDFEAREVARSTIKTINKVLMSHYKKWKEQKRKAAASLLETVQSISETGPRAKVSPFEADNLRHQKAPAQDPVDEVVLTQQEAAAMIFERIETIQKAYPSTPFAKPAVDPNNAGDVGLVHRILHELGARKDGRYDEQHLIGYVIHITAQFKGWGLGGARKALRDPGSPTGPQSLGLLVNWAQDYARIAGRG